VSHNTNLISNNLTLIQALDLTLTLTLLGFGPYKAAEEATIQVCRGARRFFQRKRLCGRLYCGHGSSYSLGYIMFVLDFIDRSRIFICRKMLSAT
jgi:hypothetical protein